METKKSNKKKEMKQEVGVSKEENTTIPFEEQMTRRQSAPRPTAQSQLQQMQMAQPQQAGAIDGFKALAQVIGTKQIQAAQQTLQKYKEGKTNLERRMSSGSNSGTGSA